MTLAKIYFTFSAELALTMPAFIFVMFANLVSAVSGTCNRLRFEKLVVEI